jgi:HAD superfamily hydrolase (TIGR01509 family)
MIKVIAFDLVGVLVNERDIVLSNEEEKLERLFGPNLSDEEYLKEANKIVNDETNILYITRALINKLYKVKDREIFKKVKEINSDVKIVIATNHISFVKDFINNNFDTMYLDDLIISAEINKIKPNLDFYKYVLDKYKIEANELLFLDDNMENINKAKELGIQTIKVEKNSNLVSEVELYIKDK